VLLNPGAPYGRASYGEVLMHAGGQPEAAVRETRFAMALDPFHPPRMRHQLGRVLLLAGRPEEALVELRPLVAWLPDYRVCHHTLITAAIEAGQADEARAAMREVLRLGPHLTMRNINAVWNFRRAEDAQRFRAAHRAAGLPEG
jgi:predicted Zn-dependent protease